MREHDWSDTEIERVIEAARAQCAASGKGPRHEFGDGESYGRRLALERAGGVSEPRRGRRDILGTLAGLIGIFATALAANGFTDASGMQVNLGTALAALAILALVTVALVFSKPMMVWLTKGGSVPVLLVGLGSVVLLTVVYLVSPERTLTVSWPAAAIVAVVTLTVSVMAAWQHAPGLEPNSEPSPTPVVVQWLLVFANPIAALALVVVLLVID